MDLRIYVKWWRLHEPFASFPQRMESRLFKGVDSAAKMYLESGGEIFKLSREMGHSNVQITEVYLKSFNSAETKKQRGRRKNV